MLPLTDSFIYGTGNPAKLAHMRTMLAPLNIAIHSLQDCYLSLPEPTENGQTPAENARFKALAYYKACRRPVFACDSGLYMEGLPENEQPGVHVRMLNGQRMNDAQMTAHYAALVRSLGGRAVARYKNAICLVMNETEFFEHSGEDLSGEAFYMVDTPHERRETGFPLDCLSVHIESGRYYYDMGEQQGVSESMQRGFQAFFQRVLQKNREME